MSPFKIIVNSCTNYVKCTIYGCTIAQSCTNTSKVVQKFKIVQELEIMNKIETGNLFPISELSNLTGVNTVTIRAWERRYGLLKPKRTEKGHRLYDDKDVETVQTILAWVNKGVSVGKVKPLLHNKDESLTVEIDEKWIDYQNRFLQSAKEFNESKIDTLYGKLSKQYPLKVCIEFCFYPLFECFDTNPKTSAEIQFLYTVIKQRMVLTVIGRNNKFKKSNPVLLFLHASHSSWKIWLSALTLSDNSIYTLVFEDIPSLALMVEISNQMNSQAVMIYSGEKTKNLALADLTKLNQDSALILSGPDIWLNKNHNELKAIQSQIIFNPIDGAQKIVDSVNPLENN